MGMQNSAQSFQRLVDSVLKDTPNTYVYLDDILIFNKTREEHLKRIGFKQGKASGNIYHHKERELSTLVHGDDYVTMGPEDGARWLEAELEKV